MLMHALYDSDVTHPLRTESLHDDMLECKDRGVILRLSSAASRAACLIFVRRFPAGDTSWQSLFAGCDGRTKGREAADKINLGP